MEIVSKLVEIEVQKPIDTNLIEEKLIKMGINPLRWAIVDVIGDKLLISLACENL